ncbi:MAG: cytochrome c biogenesis protein CcsA [Anaerolineae bacterium]|nr:cytochrome c biogenesis protein CcsA [Anaerolineae bacterium]
MLADLGTILGVLALLATLYGIVAALVSIRTRRSEWWQSAQNAFVSITALLGFSLLSLVVAFLGNDVTIRYVAQHSSSVLPIYLKLSAVWAGQEGSLLLWSFLQALFTAIAVVRPPERAEPLVPWAAVVLGVIGLFFIAVTLLLSNPFAQLAQVPADGQGLNPLLRHPGMIFHPPAMYAGYVGLSVPFAFAAAALIVGGYQRWTLAMRSWILVAWLGLSLGLLLGMRWAYDVLGWGGYWGWDPVENAGLMPWFTTTALLHGAVMQDERRGFRIWNHLLATMSFVLVLFGTFATRSGVIQSVHSYARSNLGAYFLAAIIAALASGVGLVVWRGRELTSEQNLESEGVTGNEALLSRDGLFFLTLVLFSMLTVSTLVGSTLPTLTGLLSGQKFEAGPDWFDRVTGPQFGALVLLLGVCPLLGRAAATARRLRQWGWVVALGSAVSVVIAVLAGFGKAVSLVGFAFSGLAATTVVVEFAEATVKRSRTKSMAPLNALWDLLRQQRRRYGGYLVHLGVILMAVGVIGTRMYPFEDEVVLMPGVSQAVAGYDLVLNTVSRDPGEDYVSTWASVIVTRNGAYVDTLVPRVNQYANYDQLYSVPAIRPAIREDLYLILAGWGANGASATVKVVVNVLANFLWLGGLVFLAGGALALWPRLKVQAWNIVAGVVLVALLAGASWAMWGAPSGTDRGERVTNGAARRPVIGQPAPDFRLALVDGGVVSLSDLSGQVAVLNFWAPWCPTCKENLPVLADVWRAYQDRGVTVVGAAYQSEAEAVTESMHTYEITYPVGLDVGDRMARAYGITGVPETFIIDADGNLAYIHIGPMAQDQLLSELNALVGGP